MRPHHELFESRPEERVSLCVVQSHDERLT